MPFIEVIVSAVETFITQAFEFGIFIATAVEPIIHVSKLEYRRTFYILGNVAFANTRLNE